MLLHSNILGEGKTFVILHGFLGMGDNWKTLGKKFAEQGFQVHLVDQRNHGRSFHDEEFDYESMVQDLHHYCEIYNLKDMVLLGHSMGGKTAMLFAATHPELVSKLIVADISPRFYPTHHDDILKGLNAMNFNSITSRVDAEYQLKRYVPDFGTRQFLLKNLYWIDKGRLALRLNLRALTDHVSEVGEPLPAQSRFDGDTLFLKGDRSEYIGEHDEVVIKNHFKNAKIISVKNSGHWLHAENPQDFYAEVMRFI